MIRILFIFLISYLFFCPQLHAQQDRIEWAPLGATWYYEITYMFGSQVDCLAMEAIKDTLVNQKPARLIEGILFDYSGDTIPATDVYDQGRFIIHQQGDSIYYLREGKFELLYDFSLKEGDTMNVVTPAPYQPEYVSDTMIQIVVDSIGKVVIGDDTLRKQVIHRVFDKFDSNYGFHGKIIEGIGDQHYFLPVDDLLCDDFCPLPLRCYQDRTVFYKRMEVACDTTYLMTPTENLPSPTEIRLYPNPVSSGAAPIHIEGPDRFTWKVRDIHGRILYQSKKQALGKVSVVLPAGLFSGMYLFEIYSNEGTYVRKLIVQ